MKKKLTLLIFTACAVFVGSVGLVFWALAATQVNVTSGLLVTYTPTPQVVCDTSATYQRTNDSSAIAFKNGNLSFGYGGTTTNATLEATSSALQLDDSNTYVVFEFTFVNTNQQPNYDLTITLTDNGTVTNMTRKYYFGDLSSSNISAKRTTIKNSGIDNSSLSFKKLVLGYQETGRIYMLLEITPGTVASYLADNTNKFAFTLTTAEHVEVEKVSYLNKEWAQIIYDAPSNASMIYNNKNKVFSSEFARISSPKFYDCPYEEIFFTKDISLTSGLTNSVSVGTNSETDRSAYVTSNTISDVTAYWGEDKTRIVIYSPVTIFAPKYSEFLFGMHDPHVHYQKTYLFPNLRSIVFNNFDTSNVTDMSWMFTDCSSLTSLDLGNFNLASCTNFTNMLSGCSALASITLPYNMIGDYSVQLPGEYYNGSEGPYGGFRQSAEPGVCACSTASNKVTLTKK